MAEVNNLEKLFSDDRMMRDFFFYSSSAQEKIHAEETTMAK